MKNLLNLLLIIFLLSQFLGCEKTEDGSYVPPITIYESIGGTWGMRVITQIDEIAKASSSKPDEIVLTNEFNFKDFEITFNVDSTEGIITPTSYEVTGNVPQLFLKSGYWKLDSPFPPTDGTSAQFLLYSDAAKTVLADSLRLITIPGAKPNLEFALVRSTDGVPYVTYKYLLKPLN